MYCGLFQSVFSASTSTVPCYHHHSHLNVQALERVAMLNKEKAYGDLDPSLTLYDTDTIGVCPDNCTTQHVCNNPHLMTHLVDIPFNIPMASVGGITVPKQIGTMTLTIRDDEGIDHIEKFPDTYIMPDSPKILISPVQ